MLQKYLSVSLIAAAFFVSGTAVAGGLELSALLQSPAGRFVLKELAASSSESLLRFLDSGSAATTSADFEAQLTRARDGYLRERPEDSRLFDPKDEQFLDIDQAAGLRTHLRRECEDTIRSLRFTAAPDSYRTYGTLRQRFMDAVTPQPRGGVFKTAAVRRDFLAGKINAIDMDRLTLRRFTHLSKNPAFETGRLDILLQKFPGLFEPYGFDRVGNSEKLWLEFPDVDALNARLELRERLLPGDRFNNGMRFESVSGAQIPSKDYLRMIARRRWPIADDARFTRHDTVVHGVGVAALLPREIADGMSGYARGLIALADDSRIISCKACRKLVAAAIENFVGSLDRNTAELSELAIKVGRVSDRSPVFLYELLGGAERASLSDGYASFGGKSYSVDGADEVLFKQALRDAGLDSAVDATDWRESARTIEARLEIARRLTTSNSSASP